MNIKKIPVRFDTIKSKIVLIVTIAIFIAISIIISVNNFRTSKHEGQNALDKSELALHNCYLNIQSEVTPVINSCNTLAGTFAEAYNPHTTNLSRQQISLMLKNTLLENPSCVGISTIWEPYTIQTAVSDEQKPLLPDSSLIKNEAPVPPIDTITDYTDTLNIQSDTLLSQNDTISTDTIYNAVDSMLFAGRQTIETPNCIFNEPFNIYWYAQSDGLNRLPYIESIVNHESDDFYRVPGQTLKPTITDPQYYMLQGEEILIVTYSVPIVYNSTFLGVVAMDINLNKWQQHTEAVDLFDNQAEVSIIADNGTIVALSSNQNLVGKPMRRHFSDYRQQLNNLHNNQAIRNFDSDLKICLPYKIGQTQLSWQFCIQIQRSVIFAEHLSNIWLVAIVSFSVQY